MNLCPTFSGSRAPDPGRRSPPPGGLLARLCAVALLAFAAGCGGTKEVKIIKLAHGLDPQHSVHKGMVHLAERLAAKSSGTMKVQVYASGQLGSERECLELVQLGGLAMTKVSASVLEGFAPEFKVFGLPYLFRDDAHKAAVLAWLAHGVWVRTDEMIVEGISRLTPADIRNAATLVRAGAEAVKLEGGAKRVPVVDAIVDAEVPVMGHVGLTPQEQVVDGGEQQVRCLLRNRGEQQPGAHLEVAGGGLAQPPIEREA